MSIKTKIAAVTIVAAMLLCIAIYITSETLLMGSVLDQEQEIAKQYLERIDNALHYKSKLLNSAITDWADWDDTYNFVLGKNAEYIESNITDSTIINLKLNLIAYIDTRGKLVYGTMMGLDNEREPGVYKSILTHIGAYSPIINRVDINEKFTGFLALPEGIMMITSKAILKSDQTGPAAGTLIFGRFVSSSEIQEIQELTGVPFSISSVSSIGVPPGFEKSEQTLENGEAYFIKAIDDNHLLGYSVMNDIYGRNQFLIRIDTDRTFYQKAMENTRFYIIALLICGASIIGISIFILQKLVIARLLEINRFVTKIRAEQDTSLRVKVAGNDEISNLAHEMNRMLEELDRTQEDNQRLLKEVMGLDELKNEFFSNISHEFRTPINVLLSTLQLIKLQQQNMQEDPNSQKIIRYTSIMRQNCYRLLRLANNLIDITKMDSGFFEINPSNCNIVEVIEEITLSVAEYIQDKGINLEFDTEVEEKVMSVDSEKIERIMLNLLSNAVKFTEEKGSIFVNIKDRGDSVEVSVRDTGIGIPGDKLDIIFERFRQVNSLLNRAQEGSGIGLSLVKNLVELHGGEIKVKSEYGVGTEFIFTLPVKVSPEEADQRLVSVNEQGKTDKVNMEFADIYSKK